MRIAAAVLLVLLGVSSAYATFPILTGKREKTNGVRCVTPINQLACEIEENGNIQGFWYGAWGANPAALTGAQVPYLLGEANTWYTQNWCTAWGMLGRCVNTRNPSATAISNVKPPLPGTAALGGPQNNFDPATGLQTMNYVTKMQVCYGEKRIKRIVWTSETYTGQWQVSAGNPPQAVMTATGATTTHTCGSATAACKFQVTFKAPKGKVLGGFYAKCKYSQGWFKYATNGQYKPKYYLEKIDKACAVDPLPYPTGKFTACKGFADPNNAASPDFKTYQCPIPCKK